MIRGIGHDERGHDKRSFLLGRRGFGFEEHPKFDFLPLRMTRLGVGGLSLDAVDLLVAIGNRALDERDLVAELFQNLLSQDQLLRE